MQSMKGKVCVKIGRSTPQYWHLVVKNGNFTFLLLEFILADQVADLLVDLPPVVASSGQEWQFHIATVRAHIGRSSGRSTPQWWHLVVKNGDFTLLLLELILADQVADLLVDLPPAGRSGSGSEWQFQIFTVRPHMGRSTGRSTPLVDLPVDLNGNFTFSTVRIMI